MNRGSRKNPRLRIACIGSETSLFDDLYGFSKVVPALEWVGIFQDVESGFRFAKKLGTDLMFVPEKQLEKYFSLKRPHQFSEMMIVRIADDEKASQPEPLQQVIARIIKPLTMEKFLETVRKAKYRFDKKLRLERIKAARTGREH